MLKHSHFDTRGFLFFTKFIVIISLLIISANFGSKVIAYQVYTKDNVATLQIIYKSTESLESQQIKKETIETREDEGIILGFVGDIMLDRNIKNVILKYGNNDYTFPFNLIKDRLKKYDILFGNLEGPISDKGQDQGSVYSFRMDTKTTHALKSTGFDIFSVANNHAGDWGKEAMEDTYIQLNKAGIHYSGGGFSEEQAYSPKIFLLDDTKIAYISFSEFGRGYLEAGEKNSGIAIISDKKLKDIIENTKTNSDIVIVSFHYGDEYTMEPNEYQKKNSRKAIDYGADVVIGHHPHVVQPVEIYKDKYIAYSLGNFIFDQNLKEDGSDFGAILEVFIKDKKITQIKKAYIRFNNEFQPFVVE